MGLQREMDVRIPWLETIATVGAIRCSPCESPGVTLCGCGAILPASGLFLLGATLAIAALRIFEPSVKEAKTRGVHSSFPSLFEWLMDGFSWQGRWVWRQSVGNSGGIWGASRHALTVGFISVMILSVGQRILPAFAGMRLLWSTNSCLEDWHSSLWVARCGCLARSSRNQGYANWAWSVLPVSALCELAG